MDYQFEGVVTALSSISHIGETHGINAKLRREKIVTPDGIEEIPVISGNSVRGQLRDLGMYHMLRTIGYGVNGETGEVLGLTLAAFHFLFSGGALTKQAGRGLDIDRARELRGLIPLVSVFGGAMGNQIMESKLMIGKLYPLCSETAQLVPERYASRCSDRSIWEMLQEEAYTRRDDEKNENLRPMLQPAVRALLEAKTRQQRALAGTEADVDKDVGQHQQMRHFVETFSAGTEFYWEILLQGVNPVEFEAFLTCLSEFSKRPFIGGMGRVGHGKIAVKFDWCELSPRLTVEKQAVGLPVGSVYSKHLAELGARIREVLDGIQ